MWLFKLKNMKDALTQPIIHTDSSGCNCCKSQNCIPIKDWYPPGGGSQWLEVETALKMQFLRSVQIEQHVSLNYFQGVVSTDSLDGMIYDHSILRAYMIIGKRDIKYLLFELCSWCLKFLPYLAPSLMLWKVCHASIHSDPMHCFCCQKFGHTL
jgi:hypothetical protein